MAASWCSSQLGSTSACRKGTAGCGTTCTNTEGRESPAVKVRQAIKRASLSSQTCLKLDDSEGDEPRLG